MFKFFKELFKIPESQEELDIKMLKSLRDEIEKIYRCNEQYGIIDNTNAAYWENTKILFPESDIIITYCLQRMDMCGKLPFYIKHKNLLIDMHYSRVPYGYNDDFYIMIIEKDENNSKLRKIRQYVKVYIPKSLWRDFINIPDNTMSNKMLEYGQTIAEYTTMIIQSHDSKKYREQEKSSFSLGMAYGRGMAMSSSSKV